MLSPAIAKLTARSVVQIFSVSPGKVLFDGTGEALAEQGTMTLVRYKGHLLGITNEHVASNFTRPTHERAFMLGLREHKYMPGHHIFSSTPANIDFPCDIAVFILHEPTIMDGGKIPVEFRATTQPLVGTKYLTVGFPGALRTVEGNEISSPIMHVVATCASASDRNVILHDDIGRKDVASFGGISGGAIFDVIDEESIKLVGITYEGRGPGDTAEQTFSETDVWVYGFPITSDSLDFVLNDAVSRGHSLDVQPMRLSFTNSD
jgi:hypothetical protein